MPCCTEIAIKFRKEPQRPWFSGFQVQSPAMVGAALILLVLLAIPIAVIGWSVFRLLDGVLWIHERIHRRPKATPGFCRQCGYDLRASTDRCPECGLEIATLFKAVAKME